MLGEVGELIRGNGLQKSNFVEFGYPCIHYGQIYTYYDFSASKTITFTSKKIFDKLKKAKKGDVLIAGTSENLEDVNKPIVWLGNEEIGISGDMFIFRPNEEIESKFVAHIFQTDDYFKYKQREANGTKVVRVSGDSIKKFLIPIPPLKKQREIVEILDKFSELTTDLQSGLPAEIKARRKQYEYYRDKLLNFKRAE